MFSHKAPFRPSMSSISKKSGSASRNWFFFHSTKAYAWMPFSLYLLFGWFLHTGTISSRYFASMFSRYSWIELSNSSKNLSRVFSDFSPSFFLRSRKAASRIFSSFSFFRAFSSSSSGFSAFTDISRRSDAPEPRLDAAVVRSSSASFFPTHFQLFPTDCFTNVTWSSFELSGSFLSLSTCQQDSSTSTLPMSSSSNLVQPSMLTFNAFGLMTQAIFDVGSAFGKLNSNSSSASFCCNW
mmetsp:Transcript_13771/g.33900  ORF Transcript_13771/g.33900 Transcript_13771/m.33900 type:complete len:239 (-) Transcript_13771:212-928(-)